jgi:hypothetical protein
MLPSFLATALNIIVINAISMAIKELVKSINVMGFKIIVKAI